MAALQVIEAVEARLAEAWTVSAVVGVLAPPKRPANGDPFVLVHFPVADSEQITIGAPGDNVFRETGVFLLMIHEPKAEIARAWARADALASLFRAKSFDGVVTVAPQSARFDDQNDQALYVVLSVAVPYWHDLRG